MCSACLSSRPWPCASFPARAGQQWLIFFPRNIKPALLLSPCPCHHCLCTLPSSKMEARLWHCLKKGNKGKDSTSLISRFYPSFSRGCPEESRHICQRYRAVNASGGRCDQNATGSGKNPAGEVSFFSWTNCSEVQWFQKVSPETFCRAEPPPVC